MKVHELIKELSRFDPDLHVEVYGGYSAEIGHDCYNEVSSVVKVVSYHDTQTNLPIYNVVID